jgi:spermidine synthase
VIAFAKRTVPTGVWDVCAAISVGTAGASLIAEVGAMPWKLLPHLAALFFVGLACHSRLAHDRPPAAQLTAFYLAMAVGGVAGGAFNALAAPLLFNRVLEYPAVLAVSMLIIGTTLGSSRLLVIGAAGAIVAAVGTTFVARWLTDQPVRLMVVGAAVLAVAAAWRQGLVAFAIAAALAASGLSTGTEVVRAERSFYGAMRIEDDETFRTFVHGTTTHGYQFLDPESQQTPTSYYGQTGPLGELMTVLKQDGKLGRVGAVGLGVGTIASYLAPGDKMTYFEIDPTVVKFAQDPSLFTFLSQSKGTINVVVGDGRRTLAESDQRFDVLILDAFSSDSIPVHLLTKEALQLYRSRLAAGGVMAIHISNRYLDLEPVVGAIAADLGLVGIGGHHQASDEEEAAGTTGSDWLVLAQSQADLPNISGANWSPLRTEPHIRMWTDDRADLLAVLQ